MKKKSTQYTFLKKGDELAKELADKVHSFKEYAVRDGIYSNWRKNQKFYENDFFNVSKVDDVFDAGSQGELKALAFNHFRNILKHSVNQTTTHVPSFDVSASNTDVASRRASKIGKDIVNYYYKVKRVSKLTRRAAEKGIVYGDGYVISEWNPSLGKTVARTENGRLIKEGDFDFEVASPYNVFFDYATQDKAHWDWFIFSRKRNKFEMAKLFPKHADTLISLDTSNEDDPYITTASGESKNYIETDNIYIYSCYHRATNAVPRGLYCMFAGDGDNAVMLYEGDNLYGEKLNIFCISPGDYLESSFGFADANILRTPQIVFNAIISSIVTNAMTAGANNIWTPTGSNLSVNDLTDGMNWLQSDVRPEVISFYKDAPGLGNLLQLCVSTMETLSAQNAVVRGNVQEAPNLKSGIAIATVINMAQQYAQGLEKSYVEMFEDLSTFMLDTLKKVANTERLIEIAGVSQKSSVNSFIKEDLDGVSRVIVDQTNPITKQPSGKIEIAMELLKLGQITPVQFFDVVNTGNLDVAVEADEKMLDFINAAKERLINGEAIPPIPGINHQLYIKEIHSLLFDIEILNNPQNQPIMQNILKTIQQQIDILRSGDEIANLIYGGKPPTPATIQQSEVASLRNPNKTPEQSPQSGALPQ